MTAMTIDIKGSDKANKEGARIETAKFQELMSFVKRMSSEQMARLEKELAQHKNRKKQPLLSDEEISAIQSLFSSKR
ncbi:hypothetical protein ACPV5R_17375 [Vibrio astriarenae]